MRRLASRPGGALALLCLVEFLGMSLWFSASAVLPSLTAAWSLSESARAWMTMAVQLGFVVGALGSALLNLPDIVPAHLMVAAGAGLGAVATAAIALWPVGLGLAVPLRFATGVCLAGVYPPGLKIMATWFARRRGMALGLMVGALTLGSALPHLLNAVGGLEWRRTLLAASALGAVAAVLAAAVIREGPHRAPTPPFRWRYALELWRRPPLRLANFGYLGHMWELYAMWTWLPLFLLESFRAGGGSMARAAPGVAAFAAIGAGALGCAVAGVAADRFGRTATAVASMVTSGLCSLFIGLLFGGAPGLLVAVAVVWGFAIVADSALFSTSITELGEPAYQGTALAVQIASGFLLTLVSIRLLPLLVRGLGWRYAFAVMAVGPALGSVAMWRLRHRPEAARLAGGRR